MNPQNPGIQLMSTPENQPTRTFRGTPAVAGLCAAAMFAAGCGTAGPGQSPDITEAGGWDRIVQAADDARGGCHDESHHGGAYVKVASTAPDEFRAVYVEDGGMTLRHIIAGTATVGTGGGSTIDIGYLCVYAQNATAGDPAATAPMRRLGNGAPTLPMGSGGEVHARHRDRLRDNHGVGPGDELVVHVGSYADMAPEPERP